MTDASLQIMLSLADEARHGYGIRLDVEERTAGAMRLGSGTLYEGLQRLEEWGWIEEVEPPEPPDSRPRRFYGLTPAGQAVLRQELERLDGIVAWARRHDLLGGAS